MKITGKNLGSKYISIILSVFAASCKLYRKIKTRSLPKKTPSTAAPSRDEIKTRFWAGWVKFPSQVHAPFVRSTGGLQSAAIEKSLLHMCWILWTTTLTKRSSNIFIFCFEFVIIPVYYWIWSQRPQSSQSQSSLCSSPNTELKCSINTSPTSS